MNAENTIKLHNIKESRIQVSAESSDSTDDMAASHRDSSKAEAKNNFVFYAYVLNHLSVTVFCVFITILCFYKDIVLFSWHPACLTIGFTLFSTEAVMSYSPDNVISRGLTHKGKTRLHWVLQSVSVMLVAVGFTVIYVNKNIGNKEHFTSYHGIAGLTFLICILVAFVGGVLTLYSYALRHYARPIYSKIGHALLGVTTYLIGVVTMILGLYTKWFERNAGDSSFYLCVGLLLYSAFWTLLRPTTIACARMKVIFNK